jgi:hypothetical protein
MHAFSSKSGKDAAACRQPNSSTIHYGTGANQHASCITTRGFVADIDPKADSHRAPGQSAIICPNCLHLKHLTFDKSLGDFGATSALPPYLSFFTNRKQTVHGTEQQPAIANLLRPAFVAGPITLVVPTIGPILSGTLLATPTGVLHVCWRASNTCCADNLYC